MVIPLNIVDETGIVGSDEAGDAEFSIYKELLPKAARYSHLGNYLSVCVFPIGETRTLHVVPRAAGHPPNQPAGKCAIFRMKSGSMRTSMAKAIEVQLPQEPAIWRQ